MKNIVWKQMMEFSYIIVLWLLLEKFRENILSLMIKFIYLKIRWWSSYFLKGGGVLISS